MARRDFHVTVAGGGPAGLIAVLAMRSVLHKSAKILLLDGAPPNRPKTARTYAISPSSRNLLERLQVWRRLRRAQAIKSMDITDSRLEDYIRQTYLQFQSDQKAEALGWIVEHEDLMMSLCEEVSAQGIEVIADSVDLMAASNNYNSVSTQSGKSFTTGLLIAADGGNSRVRDLIHVPVTGWSYERSAIVATVRAEYPHNGKATQHFLPVGTFALLPMTEERFSIVWVETTRDARALVEAPKEIFLEELQKRAGFEYGQFELCSKPEVFPLRLQVAQRCIGTRTALVADSAHVMHPLAGQGLNLGISDIAHLAAKISDGILVGLDIGSSSILTAYEGTRHAETARMLAATDALFRLFIGQSDLIRSTRDIGLGLVDKSSILKKRLSRIAAGQVTEVPHLLQPVQ